MTDFIMVYGSLNYTYHKCKKIISVVHLKTKKIVTTSGFEPAPGPHYIIA